MAAYSWPTTLPQYVRTDTTDSGVLTIRRTQPDAGPAKMRYVGRMPEPIKASWVMTTAQVATFKAFVYTTLRGVARFDWVHPRTRAGVEARFIPASSGDIYSVTWYATDAWIVSADLEIMP